MDVLDAGGNAIARFGYEGSVGGFLLQRGGSWVTVQAFVAAELAAAPFVLEVELVR